MKHFILQTLQSITMAMYFYIKMWLIKTNEKKANSWMKIVQVTVTFRNRTDAYGFWCIIILSTRNHRHQLMLTPWVHFVATVGTLHCLYHKKWAMKKIGFPDFIFCCCVYYLNQQEEEEKKERPTQLEKKQQENIKWLRLFTVIFHLSLVWNWIHKTLRHWSQVDQNILCTTTVDLLFGVFLFYERSMTVMMLLWWWCGRATNGPRFTKTL